MQTRDYLDNADALMARIKQGAFLTVKAGEAVNTMTIGWATIGCIWQRAVFMVAVRDSRHTFTLMEQSDTFTVTVPILPVASAATAWIGKISLPSLTSALPFAAS